MPEPPLQGAPRPAPRPAPVSPWHLFTAFTALAMQGFGGVIAVAQRELCDRRGWLTPAEFLALLGTAQVLPGPNVCNLSIMVGDHFFGWRGALAALAGMIAMPLVVLLGVAWALAQAPSTGAAQGAVKGALWGIAAVAGGQIIGTVLRLAKPLRQHPLGLPATGTLAAAAFAMMILLRWPLLWVLLSLGLAGVLWTATVLRRQAAAAADGPGAP